MLVFKLISLYVVMFRELLADTVYLTSRRLFCRYSYEDVQAITILEVDLITSRRYSIRFTVHSVVLLV